MRFSIIIPTLNEELLLPVLLDDLRAQTLRDFEIIVADAGSSDRTVEIARSLGAAIVPGGMPAVGRNRGAEHARGEFLLFLDADTRLDANFLEKASAELEERFLDLATCEVVPLSDSAFDLLLHEFSNLALKAAQFTEPHAPGFCIFISRRLFHRVGGFDESLKLAEDHDLVKRASGFRPLRVLASTEVRVSVRRLEKEGRIRLVSKQLRFDEDVRESRRLTQRLRQEYARWLTESGELTAEASERFWTQFDSLKERIRSILKRTQGQA